MLKLDIFLVLFCLFPFVFCSHIETGKKWLCVECRIEQKNICDHSWGILDFHCGGRKTWECRMQKKHGKTPGAPIGIEGISTTS